LEIFENLLQNRNSISHMRYLNCLLNRRYMQWYTRSSLENGIIFKFSRYKILKKSLKIFFRTTGWIETKFSQIAGTAHPLEQMRASSNQIIVFTQLEMEKLMWKTKNFLENYEMNTPTMFEHNWSCGFRRDQNVEVYWRRVEMDTLWMLLF
jgi:hypothetical protein